MIIDVNNLISFSEVYLCDIRQSTYECDKQYLTTSEDMQR